MSEFSKFIKIILKISSFYYNSPSDFKRAHFYLTINMEFFIFQGQEGIRIL